MKKIICFTLVGLLLCVFIPCSAAGQEKTSFLTFEQLKDQVNDLPVFFKKYEDSKVLLQNRYFAITRSQFDPDSELFRQAFTDLVLVYKESRNTLNTYSNLWVTFYLINEKPELLMQDGWSQKQIDSSKVWTSKFTEYRDRIRKIDKKTISVDHVQNFMIRVNSGLVTIL